MDPNFSSPTEGNAQENISDSPKTETTENLERAEINFQENISDSPKIETAENLENNNNATNLGVFDSSTPEGEELNNTVNHQTSNTGSMGGGQQTASGTGNSVIQQIGDGQTTEINNYHFLESSAINRLISNSDSSNERQNSFTDPTTNLPSQDLKSSQLSPQLELEEFSSYVQILLEENILIVSCLNQEVLMATVYALASQIEAIKDKRLLSFEGKNSKRLDLEIEAISEEEGIGRGKDTLVVIDAVRKKVFWDSLRVHSPWQAGIIKDNLKNQNRFLICLVDPVVLYQEESFFCCWKIPFLKNLLKIEFPSDFCEVYDKISVQRAKGFWGNNDQEFYDFVYGFIKSKTLYQEVEKREKLHEENAGIEEIEEQLKPIQVNDLLPENKDNQIIEKTVLYVATFFPNLSPNNFLRLVSLLIDEDDVVTVPITSEKVMDDGSIKEFVLREKINARKFWKDNSDDIKRKCGLRSPKYKERARIIDFHLPYIRRDLEEYFEEEYSTFLQQKFTLIQELGLLFVDDSPRVTENVIKLYANMANSYPEDYGDDWLVKIILHSTKRFEVNPSSQLTEQDLLLKLLEAFESELVFTRISDLIREMLQYPQLEDMIDSFLEKLISWTRHDAVLAIVKCLRFAPKFRTFYWISQLLERSNEITRNEAYKFLYSQAKQSNFRIYEFFEEIQSWLPEANREKKFSQTNQYSLRLFVEYCLESKIPIKYYGQWPSKHRLFSVFSKQDKNTYTDILTQWLLNPGLENDDFELNKNSNFSFTAFVGSLLPEWWAILYGLENMNPHKEAIQTMNAILQKVISTTSVTQQNHLIDFWEELKKELLELMAYLEDLKFKISESTFKLKDKETILALNYILSKSVGKNIQLRNNKNFLHQISMMGISIDSVIDTLEIEINQTNRNRQIVGEINKSFKRFQ